MKLTSYRNEFETTETKARAVVKKSVTVRDIYLFKTTVLRALSDQTRQGIIILLGKHQSLCVNDLAAYFNVSRPTVSHHLHVLKEAKMVRSSKNGKEVYYTLNVRYIRRAIRNLNRIVDSIEPVETSINQLEKIKEEP